MHAITFFKSCFMKTVSNHKSKWMFKGGIFEKVYDHAVYFQRDFSNRLVCHIFYKLYLHKRLSKNLKFPTFVKLIRPNEITKDKKIEIQTILHAASNINKMFTKYRLSLTKFVFPCLLKLMAAI